MLNKKGGLPINKDSCIKYDQEMLYKNQCHKVEEEKREENLDLAGASRQAEVIGDVRTYTGTIMRAAANYSYRWWLTRIIPKHHCKDDVQTHENGAFKPVRLAILDGIVHHDDYVSTKMRHQRSETS